MIDQPAILLSTTYFGPVQYFTKFLLPGQVYLEKQENYIKQSYRNRCNIYGPNGPQSLVVPVKRGSFHTVPVAYLEIDYKTPWQDIHSRSIESAYRSAPFYEYYIDAIIPFFQSQTRYLFDLNTTIVKAILQLLGSDTSPDFTQVYLKRIRGWDYRESIHPKDPPADPSFQPACYIQVFSPKFGFIPNLSILDLLFNTGPEAIRILEKSLVWENNK